MPAIPNERWALAATATVELAPGDYTLRTISDEGVRVWVDGNLAIDDWGPHESAVEAAALAPGKHELRVEYYQVDGWTELRVEHPARDSSGRAGRRDRTNYAGSGKREAPRGA